MRSIDDINEVFSEYFSKLCDRLEKTMEKGTDDLKEEIKSRATLPSEMSIFEEGYTKHDNPSHFSNYLEKFSTKVEREKYEIKGNVSNSYNVIIWKEQGGDVVPFGCLLEWGTGTLGKSTSNKEQMGRLGISRYADSYAWDEQSRDQQLATGTWGSPATPHWTPAFNYIKPKIIKEVKENIYG